MSKTKSGFTIVELLIVIVVIGILAAITIVAYNGIQDRARATKIQSDLAQFTKAIQAARTNENKTMGAITGSYKTGENCWGKPDGTDLATVPTTDNCWIKYNTALTTISDSSGINIKGLKDPWGRPYLIDENEGENGGCGKDTIGVYKLPFTTTFGVNTIYGSTGNVSLSGNSGCST